ncbi:MAG: hypothetical protein ACX936_19800, partial [Marinobacter sp.]
TYSRFEKEKKDMKVSGQQLYGYLAKAAKNEYGDFFTNGLKLVTVSDMIQDKPPFKENYGMIGIMYSMVHHAHAMTPSMQGSKLFYSNPKRGKHGAGYNRIYYFGDVDGNVFAIIERNELSAQATVSFALASGESPIGMAFLLFEPTKGSGAALKVDMPVMEMEATLLPFDASIVKGLITQIMPSVPSEGSEETFFLLKNVKIELFRSHVLGKGNRNKPSCSGVFCDRQRDYETKKVCGCFSTDSTNLSSIILSYTVEILNPNDYAGFNDELVPREFMGVRSFRSTKLFLRNMQELSLEGTHDRSKVLFDIRKSIRSLVELINENGGFTLMGVLSRGEKKDESGESNTKIASNRIIGHISYLMPSESSIMKTVDFRKKQYNCQVSKRSSASNAVASTGTEDVLVDVSLEDY